MIAFSHSEWIRLAREQAREESAQARCESGNLIPTVDPPPGFPERLCTTCQHVDTLIASVEAGRTRRLSDDLTIAK
jgi:hypothetical protein